MYSIVEQNILTLRHEDRFFFYISLERTILYCVQNYHFIHFGGGRVWEEENHGHVPSILYKWERWQGKPSWEEQDRPKKIQTLELSQPGWTPAPPNFCNQISSSRSVSDSQFPHLLSGLNNLTSQEHCEYWLNNTWQHGDTVAIKC